MRKLINLVAWAALLFAPAVATAQTALTDDDLPMTFTFEDDSEAGYWAFSNDATNAWVIGTAEKKDGAKALYISDDGGTTYHYLNSTPDAYSYAYLAVTLTSGEYALQFDWKGTAEGNWDYTNVYLIPQTETPTSGTAPSSTARRLTASNLSGQSAWQQVTTTFIVTDEQAGDYYLALVWKNDNSNGSEPTCVDNFYFGKLTCPAPVELTVSDVTNEGATLTWTPTGAESAWRVLVDGEEIADSPVYEASITLSGYEANTQYAVSVVAVCGDDDESMSLSGSFKTLCANGNCELRLVYSGYTPGEAQVWQNGALMGTYSYYGDGTTVDICAGDPVVITYVEDSWSYGTNTWTVYDLADVEVASFVCEGHSTGDTIWSANNGCPTCMPTDNVTASGITTEGATITWGENGATAWALYLDGEEIEGVNPWTTNSYELSGLEPNTQYTFGVVVLCDDEDSSYMRTVSFRTACDGDVCDMTFTTSTYVYYDPHITVWQNGSAVATVTANTTLLICSADSLYLRTMSGDWTVTDAGGVELELGTGDTVYAAATGCPSCIPPSGLYISEADVDYLQASWDPISNAEGYLVYFDSVLVTPNVITDTFYLFSDLEQMSQHQIWVRAYCGGDDTSAYRRMRASTPCAVAEIDPDNGYSIHWLNYVYSRNSDPNWQVRPQSHDDYSCWYFSHPCVQPRGDAEPDNGDNGIWFLSPSDGGCSQIAGSYFCLPIFDAPINQQELNFRAKVGLWGSTDTPDRIVIGIADISGENVEWLDTINGKGRGNLANGSHPLYDHIRFDDYSGNGVRFAIKLINYTNWNCFTWFNVKLIPECSEPVALTGHNYMDADSTYYTWTVQGGATQWQVNVLGAEDPLGDLSEGAVTVDEPSYVLPHLTLGGHYTIWVRTVCGDQYSEWVSHTFYSGTVVMPETGTDTVTGCGVVVYDNGYQGGYINGSNSTIVVRPAAAGDLLVITGGWFSNATENSGTLTIYDGEGTTGEVLFSTSGSVDSFDTIYSELGAMTINLYAGTYAAPGIEIYTACVPAPTCRRPKHLTVSDITGTSATLSWDSGNATADSVGGTYDVYIKNLSDESIITLQSIDSVYIIDEGTLQPETEYEAWVVGVCSENDQSLSSDHITFRSGCANGECVFSVEPPYFDIYGTIDVWQNGELFANVSESSQEVHTCLGSQVTLTWNSEYSSSYYGFSVAQGDSVLVSVDDPSGMSNGDTIVVFDGQCNATVYDIAEPVDPYNPSTCDAPTGLTVDTTETTATVSFSGNYSAEGYQVEIVEGEWEGSMGNAIDTEEESYTFSDLQAATAYTIAVRAVCDSEEGEYSDWVTVSFVTAGVAECAAPTSVEVPAVGIDSTTAVVTWQAAAGTTKWQLHVTAAGYDNMFEATGTASYILNGLTPSTSYTVVVRTICSVADTSEWSASTTFRTNNVETPGDGIDGVDALGVSLYPNPAASSVTIEVAEVAEVSLVDLNGRVCGRWHTTGSLTLDVTTLAKGAYYVRLVGESGIAVRKLVVE